MNTDNTTKREMLISNDHNWYVVTFDDKSVELRHSSSLSSIFECGHPKSDFGIEKIEQCWNGEDLEAE